MLRRDRRVPALVEETAVPEHAIEIRLRRLRADRGAAEMIVAAEALVAARRDLPARLANPVGQIRFIPFRRAERFA